MELVWGGFLAFFLTLLFLDLSVLHRESAELSVKQALFWTAVWVSVAMSFTLVIYGLYEHRWLGFVPGPGVRDGADAVVLFVTGYLLEWSLSVDNIFVIALIFAGDTLAGFATALAIGVFVGTYSSIFVASSIALDLKLTARDLMPAQREKGAVDDMP